jgi:hypothetical protein
LEELFDAGVHARPDLDHHAIPISFVVGQDPHCSRPTELLLDELSDHGVVDGHVTKGQPGLGELHRTEGRVRRETGTEGFKDDRKSSFT